jgi:hypothetical protein
MGRDSENMIDICMYLHMLGSRQGFWEYALRMRGTRQGVWEYTTYMIGSKQGFWEYAYFGGVHFKTGTKKKVLCPVYTCQHLQIKQSDRMMQDGGRAGKMPSGHESSSWAYIYTCIYIYIYIYAYAYVYNIYAKIQTWILRVWFVYVCWAPGGDSENIPYICWALWGCICNTSHILAYTTDR